MRVVVAGGSGFVGRALAERLESQGSEVTLLTRRPGVGGPGRAMAWDGRGPGDWTHALDGADAVVNLAGESVADGRWTDARKETLRESRLLSTRALVSALAAGGAKPKVLINASAVGYYGDRGDAEVTEASAPGGDFLARLCVDWEAEAMKAAAAGVRVVCLRIGIVLGREGGALRKMLLPFQLGLGGPLGSGRQWMSWISREDLVDLIALCLTDDLSGAVNAVAPAPVTNRDFAEALGRALGRPAALPAPAFALRLALGEMAGMLLGGQKVVPVKALKARFGFRHPDLDSALATALR